MANNIIYVFHIKKADGSGVFLHPLDEFDKIVSQHASFQLAGRYGNEPVVESFTLLRNTLYRSVEESVDNIIMESRFIPRFLGSAVVFIIAYFFFSFAIRDPIPLVDEILLGLAAATVFYIIKGRKYKKSDAAVRLRVFYRGMIDNITFVQSKFVLLVESLIYAINSKTIEEIAGQIYEYPQLYQLAGDEFIEERSQFLSCIEKKLKKSLTSSQKRILNKLILTGIEKNFSLLKNFNFIDVASEIDINIFIAYIILKQVKFSKTAK
jgi:hypothetical protein